MTDTEFLQAFEACTIPNTEFNHQAHIRMAWLYLNQLGFESGSQKIVEGIKRFAASKNSQLYHETITHFWIHLVQHAIEVNSDIKDVNTLMTQIPCLHDSKSIYRHYSRDLLRSDKARHHKCDPDLLALPLLADA